MTSTASFGDRGVLVTCADRIERRTVRAVLTNALPEVDVREGVRSVLVTSAYPDPELLRAVVRALEDVKTGKPADARQSAEVEIEVRYDGIDLDESALVLGVSVPELVSAHSRQEWQVDLMGFAPGFGYLVPIGERMVDWPRLPRRDRPRESVPRGSVAIAAGMSAVYPAAMPGGWHLLGTTEAHLFDATMRLQPSLLVPGSRVRFREVSR